MVNVTKNKGKANVWSAHKGGRPMWPPSALVWDRSQDPAYVMDERLSTDINLVMSVGGMLCLLCFSAQFQEAHMNKSY